MYIIIQPTSSERVLSGICYMPQWLYVAMRIKNVKCEICEDMAIGDIDNRIKRSEHGDQIVVNLSSYPQASTCQTVYETYRGRYDIAFFGLEPLIRSLGLPVMKMPCDIMDGVINYGWHIEHFKKMPVNDYDKHLASSSNEADYQPLFLSVGCERKCPYCYVGYSNFPQGHLSLEKAKEVILRYSKHGYNIHFYDEDFYAYPHVDEIIGYLQDMGIKWICLATSVKMAETIKRLGADAIRKSGNVLNEIGIETASAEVLEKKQNLKAIIESGLNLFWLTVTFFPNEDLRSKRLTGEFLRQYGYGWDELQPRIRTNSSHGGLGQFFQGYHGTPWHKELPLKGTIYTDTPTRLWPSFVGKRFLNETPKAFDRACLDYKIDPRWFTLYGDEEMAMELQARCDGRSRVEDIANNDLRKIVLIAQLAQMGMIG